VITSPVAASGVDLPINTRNLRRTASLGQSQHTSRHPVQPSSPARSATPTNTSAASPSTSSVLDSRGDHSDTYWLLSQEGITSCSPSGSQEFTPLSHWLRERSLFAHIKAIPFFAKFRLWRSLRLWHAGVVHRRRRIVMVSLAANSFALDPFLASTLATAHSSFFMPMSSMQLFQCHFPQPISTEQWRSAQSDHLANAMTQLCRLAESLQGFLFDACVEYIRQAGVTDDAAERVITAILAKSRAQQTYQVPADVTAAIRLGLGAAKRPHPMSPNSAAESLLKMKHTAAARHRALARRLVCFLRVLDLRQSNALRLAVLQSLSALMLAFASCDPLQDSMASRVSRAASDVVFRDWQYEHGAAFSLDSLPGLLPRPKVSPGRSLDRASAGLDHIDEQSAPSEGPAVRAATAHALQRIEDMPSGTRKPLFTCLIQPQWASDDACGDPSGSSTRELVDFHLQPTENSLVAAVMSQLTAIVDSVHSSCPPLLSCHALITLCSAVAPEASPAEPEIPTEFRSSDGRVHLDRAEVESILEAVGLLKTQNASPFAHATTTHPGTAAQSPSPDDCPRDDDTHSDSSSVFSETDDAAAAQSERDLDSPPGIYAPYSPPCIHSYSHQSHFMPSHTVPSAKGRQQR
jgi:hypothetical protein